MEITTILIIGLGVTSLGIILYIIFDKFLCVILGYISIVFLMIGFIMLVIGLGEAGIEYDKTLQKQQAQYILNEFEQKIELNNLKQYD